MDVDSSGGSKASSLGLQENGFVLYPVSVNDSGEGLPYAPEDWPNNGDKWRWKVGKRIAASGYFLDRYMYLPRSLCQRGHKKGFASKLSLKEYIRANFPDTNVDDFFASFSWKIPSQAFKKDDKEMFRHLRKTPGPDVQIDEAHCQAGNTSCSSLAGGEDPVSVILSCYIFCSEPGFCRDCCCILCREIIDKASGSYSYIRCEANIKGFACGHSCHIDCALRSYMAGTVGGSIGLDAEYYCRRCDSRTDLISHVTKLLENCESIVSLDDIEKILKVGICVLRGSKKRSAKELLRRIELAVSKLKNGTYLEDIWKKEDEVFADIAENDESQDCEMNSSPTLSLDFDHRVESLKLEVEIDCILDELRKLKDIEYRLLKEKLLAQKNYILNLYQQLDKERSDLSRHVSLDDQDSLLDVVLNRVDQIKREVSRLKDMAEVAKGFGRVPKHIIKEQFGLDIEH